MYWKSQQDNYNLMRGASHKYVRESLKWSYERDTFLNERVLNTYQKKITLHWIYMSVYCY